MIEQWTEPCASHEPIESEKKKKRQTPTFDLIRHLKRDLDIFIWLSLVWKIIIIIICLYIHMSQVRISNQTNQRQRKRMRQRESGQHGKMPNAVRIPLFLHPVSETYSVLSILYCCTFVNWICQINRFYSLSVCILILFLFFFLLLLLLLLLFYSVFSFIIIIVRNICNMRHATHWFVSILKMCRK